MDYILLLYILLILLFIILIFIKKFNLLHENFEENIPTYAVYQPENSGRHLNFFSHAPKETLYFPEKIWTSLVADPYYQPAYSNYFYNDGYFYPLC